MPIRSQKNHRAVKLVLSGLMVVTLLVLASLVPSVIDKVVINTTKINDYRVISNNLLGLDKPVNILLLFENNAESRPGGGFIGSVGYLRVDKGKIKPEPVRSVYYYDYKFKEVNYVEPAPDAKGEPMLYTLRDSGQSLDWPANAKRAKTIFSRESGLEVDIVVAITPEILKQLISDTGPIVLEDYGLTVTADNITQTLQLEVESGQDKVERKDPKTVLSSVANELIKRLSEKSVNDLTKIGSSLRDQAKQRQILVYGSNYDLAESLSRLGYDGSLVAFESDYFLLTENNYSVDKSNAFITRQLDRKLAIDPDGSVTVDVKLTRTQNLEQSFPYVDPVDQGTTFLVKSNKSYMKFAVPAGSKLDSAKSNIDIEYKGKERGYDVYGFNSELVPLEPSEYTFSYKLPYILADDDTMTLNSFIQLQNGGWPYQIRNSVVVPKEWQLSASNKKDLFYDQGSVVYDSIIDRDLYMSYIYVKK